MSKVKCPHAGQQGARVSAVFMAVDQGGVRKNPPQFKYRRCWYLYIDNNL